ncbi:hypothetical protein FIBSPDRAFT_903866 [Athelia psychrophila]|uniref:Uncharacterized protein n=1 Tax=Athelia psychrophila TaxID=1759441 RepID=A0A167VFN0_9AGAM|nr:hypothetical protein FIBSPDRAFT_903866 [Fibularhizoctonia sp. CBS 109695]
MTSGLPERQKGVVPVAFQHARGHAVVDDGRRVAGVRAVGRCAAACDPGAGTSWFPAARAGSPVVPSGYDPVAVADVPVRGVRLAGAAIAGTTRIRAPAQAGGGGVPAGGPTTGGAVPAVAAARAVPPGAAAEGPAAGDVAAGGGRVGGRGRTPAAALPPAAFPLGPVFSSVGAAYRARAQPGAIAAAEGAAARRGRRVAHGVAA